MSQSTVTCPECEAVLKSKNPMPDGKKIRCPKCATEFVVGARTAKPVAKAAKAKAAPAAPAKAAPVPARKPVDDDDDDDGGGTYAVSGGQEETDAPVVSYAPDMSIKDLRGPAQEMVVIPTNYQLIVGAVGFLGWVVFLLLVLIPRVFPDPAMAKAKDAGPTVQFAKGSPAADAQAREKKSDDNEPLIQLFGHDFNKIGWVEFFLWIGLSILGMVYCSIVVLGTVKAQNLEGRGFAIASTILGIIPFNVGGVLLVAAMVFYMLLGLVFEGDLRMFYVIIVMTFITLGNAGVGVWNLMTLNHKTVVDGFEFVPE
jgi:uncharacterized Zn finger protein (UPF0148 family)